MVRGEFAASAVLPAPARSYFIERDSAAFQCLLSKALKIGTMEFREMWEEDGSTFVRLVTKPEFGAWVPKGVSSSVKASQLEFHDIVEYNPAYISEPPYRIFVRTESPLLGDKLDIRLTLTIEEVDEGSCRQTLEGHIRVGIFGVGRVVESIVKDSLVNTYKKLPDIVRRWQAFRAETIARGEGRSLLAGRPPLGANVGWIQREVLAPASPAAVGGAGAGAGDASVPAIERASGDGSHVSGKVASGGDAGVPAFATPAAGSAQVHRDEASRSPGPSRSPSCTLRRTGGDSAAGTESIQPCASEYYDAEDDEEAGGAREGEAAAVSIAREAEEGAEELQQAQQAVQERGEQEAERGPNAAAAQPPAHHRRASSWDSVGLPAGAGVPDHKASAPLWERFNRYWHDWEHYWQQEGVESAAGGASAASAEDTEEGSLLGLMLGALGRNLYYSSALLLVVVYLSLARHGVVKVQPDQLSRRRRWSAGEAGGGAGGRAAGAPGSGLQQRRTVSLDRAEAELAARIIVKSRAARQQQQPPAAEDSAAEPPTVTIRAVPGSGRVGSTSGPKAVHDLAQEGALARRRGRPCLCFCAGRPPRD